MSIGVLQVDSREGTTPLRVTVSKGGGGGGGGGGDPPTGKKSAKNKGRFTDQGGKAGLIGVRADEILRSHYESPPVGRKRSLESTIGEPVRYHGGLEAGSSLLSRRSTESLAASLEANRKKRTREGKAG